MTSRLTEPTGMQVGNQLLKWNILLQFQPQLIVYLTDEYRAVGLFPRYYVHFHSSILLRARNRRITMLPGNEQCQSNPEDQVGE